MDTKQEKNLVIFCLIAIILTATINHLLSAVVSILSLGYVAAKKFKNDKKESIRVKTALTLSFLTLILMVKFTENIESIIALRRYFFNYILMLTLYWVVVVLQWNPVKKKNKK